MSKIDIELQNQTSEVSTTEMMLESESIKRALEQKIRDTQKDIREDK